MPDSLSIPNRKTRTFNFKGKKKKKKRERERENYATKLTSSSFPFIGTEALAFTWDKITKSEPPASCIEARINSAERMLQE
jgi:hypothetical protein